MSRVRVNAHCLRCPMLVLAGGLLSVDAKAVGDQGQTDIGSDARGGVTAESTATADKRTVIVLVGASSTDPKLEALLAELLDRSGIQSRFVHQNRLQSEQILTSTRGDPAVWVFIHLRDGHSAELLFRDATGERFLLREFALPHGIDELGREGLGQVVESAVGALFSTEQGLSREQAKALLASHAPKPLPSPTVRRDAPTNPNSSQLFGWIAPRYEANFVGSKLGIGHGPGLELGFGRRSPHFVRLRLGYCRWFSQSIDTGLVTAQLSTHKFRTAIDLGVGLSPSNWVVFGLGASGDLTRISPEASEIPSVRLAGTSSDFVPAATAEVRYELNWRPFAAALAINAAIPLLDTHYDVSRPGGSERQAVLAKLGLGAAVILAFQPLLSGSGFAR
jgi:hypothetical protein